MYPWSDRVFDSGRTIVFFSLIDYHRLGKEDQSDKVGPSVVD